MAAGIHPEYVPVVRTYGFEPPELNITERPGLPPPFPFTDVTATLNAERQGGDPLPPLDIDRSQTLYSIDCACTGANAREKLAAVAATAAAMAQLRSWQLRINGCFIEKTWMFPTFLMLGNFVNFRMFFLLE